ncbi:MAG: hypothetical protein ERJ67_11070 [Aphanocapsa feldmannii 277cV]|uniref:Uncharacterized protein n=1 Tax=Aphanocapsa feldmannii 277cV TaxID=2507553 RepID=A0A524RLQ2_9CHRO|nr:MAG: hypothetical protein ERJ67_11070 [Aphanocapsa feldmannii 277cV]
MKDFLFYEKDLYKLINSYPDALKREVDALANNFLLGSDEDEVVDMLVLKLQLVAPMLSGREKWSQSVKDTKIDVSHDPMRSGFFSIQGKPPLLKCHEVTINIPFDGNGNLFEFKPSYLTSNPPRGSVSKETSTLSFSIIQEQLAPDAINHELDKIISNINNYLVQVRKDCKPWNDGLREAVLKSIHARKNRLLQQDKLGNILGIQTREDGKEDRKKTYTIPSIRRPKPRTLSVSKENREPTLSTDDYEYILDVISRLGRDMEKTPETYARKEEEHIRDHFLSTLATHVKGGATRETFNKEGKTDILIQVNGRNIFIGECKIWKGEKSFQEAIDQTLGYLTCRDTKAALIIFSKNNDFTNVQSKIFNSVPNHPNYKNTQKLNMESQERYVFRHKDDPDREILLTILAFNFFAR